jgi:hypothetical protein
MDLEDWIDVGALSTGRRLFVLEQMRTEAEGMGGHEDIVQRIDEARAHDVQARDMEDQWGGVRSGNFDVVGVGVMDPLLDRRISAVRDGAEVQRQGAAPDDPIQDTVDSFLKAAFPEGVYAVTSLPHVEQLSETEKLLGKLRGPLAAQVTELGLERQVARIEEIVPQYRAALRASGELPIEFAPVREARRRGQRYLFELVAMVLGRHNRADDPAQRATRERLLAPLWKQVQAARALRGRRAGSVAKPDTGELPAGEVPGEQPGQPGEPATAPSA